MASPSPTVVVSVIGLSRLDRENFSSHQGIGKSCLCYRFMYPGYDGYQQDHRSHCSLLALHEFESDVIHKDHFLYWGSTTRTYDVKGSSEMVHFEVLEHTVFYEDITDEPFLINSSKKSIWSLDAYLKMALESKLDSPGKLSYKNRDLISAPQEYGSVLFPPGIGKHKRGFVVVIDVSDNGPTFENRLRITEKMAKHLADRKDKFVVAATKRDESFAPSLEKLSELARTCKFTLIEVSAKSYVNVSEAFEIVAAKVLGKTVQGLSTHVPAYHDAALKTLSNREKARHAFRTYLQKRVTVASEFLKAILLTEEYKACAHLIGKLETNKMFAQHVLTIRNDEISTYPDVADNVGMRQQFLETYVVEKTDLSPYSSYLKDLIIKICQMCSNKVSILPPPTTPLLEFTTDWTSDPNPQDPSQDAAGKKSYGELCMCHSEATQSLDGNNSSWYAQVKNGPASVSGKKANIDPGIVTAKIIMESDGNLMFLPPAFISDKISLTPDTMIPTSSPHKNYFASLPVPMYHTLRPPTKPPQVDGLANNNHSVCQVDSTVDFIDHDEATQEVDEGIYAMIMDNQTDMHSHVCDEKEEDALEGQDNEDNDNYMYIQTNSYRVIDIAGSEHHDACIPITGVEASNEEDHKSVNTSEVSGLDLESVAASQSLQYTAQVYQSSPKMIPSSAKLHKPLGQKSAQEKDEDYKPLLTQGNMSLTPMAPSGVAVVDPAASPLSRLRGVDDQVGMGDSLTPLFSQSSKVPLQAVKLNQAQSKIFSLIQPNIAPVDRGRRYNGVNDSGSVTEPMDEGTTAKLSSEKDDTLTASLELETSKEITVLEITPNRPPSESDDEYVDITGMEMSEEVEDPDYVNTYATLHLDQGTLAATQSIEQPSSQLHQLSAQEEGKDKKPLHAQGSTMLRQMAHSGVGIVDLAASPLSRQRGVEDQGSLTLHSPKLTQAFSFNQTELDTIAPPTTDNRRLAKEFSDHEVMPHPMSVGTIAKKSMGKYGVMNIVLEPRTANMPPTKQTVMPPVTTSKTEKNVEILTLAKIREKLGKEMKKDKDCPPFHYPLSRHSSMPPSPLHSPDTSASEFSFKNTGNQGIYDFAPYDDKSVKLAGGELPVRGRISQPVCEGPN